MHKEIVILFSTLVYFALVCYGLYIFEAGILASALFLFGVPSYFLARASIAPAPVVFSIVALGLGLSVILEGAAFVFGLWSTAGVEAYRIFGMIPVEVVMSTVLQTLFLALLYELLFDDGDYTTSSARTRFGAFCAFTGGSLVSVLLLNYVLRDLFVSYAYILLTLTLLMASLVTLMMYKALTLRTFDKIANFTVVAAMPLAAFTLLGVANGHVVFDATNYIGMVGLFGVSMPIEQLLLICTIPFFVATVYELYLDDRV